MSLLPTPSAFAQNLARIAQDQFDRFHTFQETDPPLSNQIKKYYATLGFQQTSARDAAAETSWVLNLEGYAQRETLIEVTEGKA